MLDILFSPLLNMEPVISVFIFSVFIITLINVFQKLLVNQEEAKGIKEKLKLLNEEIKQAQKDNNKAKVDSLFSELMKENNRMMGMTMKPTMASLVIVFFLLPWIASVYGDITPKLDNGAGEIEINGEKYSIAVGDNELEIGTDKCSLPCMMQVGGFSWNIAYDNNNVKFSRIIAFLPVSLPLLGSDAGWLGWYFLTSIPLAILARKLLKISI